MWRRTIRSNRAAKATVLKWMINRRRRLIGPVLSSCLRGPIVRCGPMHMMPDRCAGRRRPCCSNQRREHWTIGFGNRAFDDTMRSPMAQTSNRETPWSIRRQPHRKQTDATDKRCGGLPAKRNATSLAELTLHDVARSGSVEYPGGARSGVSAGRTVLPATNSQNHGMHGSGVVTAAAIAISFLAAP